MASIEDPVRFQYILYNAFPFQSAHSTLAQFIGMLIVHRDAHRSSLCSGAWHRSDFEFKQLLLSGSASRCQSPGRRTGLGSISPPCVVSLMRLLPLVFGLVCICMAAPIIFSGCAGRSGDCVLHFRSKQAWFDCNPQLAACLLTHGVFLINRFP